MKPTQLDLALGVVLREKREARAAKPPAKPNKRLHGPLKPFQFLYGKMIADTESGPYFGPFECLGPPVFAESMGQAWDILRRCCPDWRKRRYEIREVQPGDFDYPKDN